MQPSAPGVTYTAQDFGFASIQGPLINQAGMTDGEGDTWYVLCFTAWPQLQCEFGPDAAGFKTMPMPINGPGQSMNGCACGITLPDGVTMQGVAFLPGGSNPAPMTDAGAWAAANTNTTGMTNFVAPDPSVAGQIAALQGPEAQAFVSPGPYVINDSFFDVYVLVEAEPGVTEADFNRHGSIGLYGIDDLGGGGANVFPEADPGDFCTQGEPQIIFFSPSGPVAVEAKSWGSVKKDLSKDDSKE
ncbi:MAG: hypothetical protein HKN21_09665 [Candidatus Eisenbacteria bacterium]|uniref:Uncharacterized protein n=1 Tax=Eiseniibacteriota bacterium TaxID=2212470 RepID=A0A7Y2E9E6_UNCEI|nr:hypothetical protein [Candidatus Eisenbacteria bacterium]